MSKMHPSVEGFADFLASKPPEETYRCADIRICATTQYYKSLGLRWQDQRDNSLDVILVDIAAKMDAVKYTRSFGYAAQCARSYLNQEK